MVNTISIVVDYSGEALICRCGSYGDLFDSVLTIARAPIYIPKARAVGNLDRVKGKTRLLTARLYIKRTV